MKPQVTLKTFLAMMKEDVSTFAAMWQEQRSKNPKDWPASFSTFEEWKDQYLAWLEGGKKS